MAIRLGRLDLHSVLPPLRVTVPEEVEGVRGEVRILVEVLVRVLALALALVLAPVRVLVRVVVWVQQKAPEVAEPVLRVSRHILHQVKFTRHSCKPEGQNWNPLLGQDEIGDWGVGGGWGTE